MLRRYGYGSSSRSMRTWGVNWRLLTDFPFSLTWDVRTGTRGGMDILSAIIERSIRVSQNDKSRGTGPRPIGTDVRVSPLRFTTHSNHRCLNRKNNWIRIECKNKPKSKAIHFSPLIPTIALRAAEPNVSRHWSTTSFAVLRLRAYPLYLFRITANSEP